MATPLSAIIDIDAAPSDVWAVVSDLKRMGEWSPQCAAMKVFGPVRAGTRTVNVNRRGRLVWATSAKVVRFEPERLLAFRIVENRTVWSYYLEPTDTGTRLTERREAPGGTSKVSDALIKIALGGATKFEAELERGMNATLSKIKAAAEGARTVES
ncbi:MAG: SRPBCC family protein [Rhodococcus sp. (in: high G+C Gram-positive bacteria)]